jgi:ureidoacrylate peracid hydrolase
LLVAATAAGATAAVPGTAHAQRALGRTVEIAARPDPLRIDTAKTAVLVVDMQNDFGAEGGMFDRAGIDISGIRSAVPTTAQALDAARGAGIASPVATRSRVLRCPAR